MRLPLAAALSAALVVALAPVAVADVRFTSAGEPAAVRASDRLDDLLVPSIQAAPACTITWDGGGTSSLWIEAANWSPDREPVATDHVCTGPGPTKTGCNVLGATGCIIIEGGETISVKSIQGQRTLYSWGDLSVTDPGGEALLSRFEQDNGTLRGPGVLRVTDFAWGGGTHSGSGMLRADGTTQIYDTVSFGAGGRRLQTANGSWSDGSISGASGVVWTITGTFAAQGQGHPLSWTEQPGGVRPQLRVQGTLTVATYDFPTRVDWAIDNENLVKVTSGWLRFAGGASENTGRFESSNAELAFTSGTFTFAAGTYDGLKIAGARLEIPQGGTFTGSGLTSTSGTVAVAGTLAGSLGLTGGSVLTGSGNVTGAVTNTSGIVRPGSSPGHLTVGSYTQGAAGKLHVELAGTGQGTTYDWLEVTGAAALDGVVEVSLLGGFDPAPGAAFQFLTSGSRTGTFDDPAVYAPMSGGRTFRLDYPASAPRGARLVVQPEPPTAATFSRVSARPACDGVQLKWHARDDRAIGFTVFVKRGRAARTRVNRRLIGAAGLAAPAYRLYDARGDRGDRYWIRMTDRDGEHTVHGPFRAAGRRVARMTDSAALGSARRTARRVACR